MNNEQHSISRALGVTADFDAALEAGRRIDFLRHYLRQASCRTFVLGISGGVDSLAAGLLAQTAVSQLRADGYDARFIAVRLPYGVQADETDAQKSLSVISPDRIVTIDIKPAADAMLDAVIAEGEDLVEPDRKHFHLGNIKARQRMIAQYALAGSTRGLVIGTDQAAEALMGFFTKFGDGAADMKTFSARCERTLASSRTQLPCLGGQGRVVADLQQDRRPRRIAHLYHGNSHVQSHHDRRWRP